MKAITATIALALFGLFSADLVTGETDYSAVPLMVAIDDGDGGSVLLVPLEHGTAAQIGGPCNPNQRSTRYE